LNVNWVAHDIRDQVVDFVRRWSERTELPAKRLLGWAELCPRQYARWQERYGQANEHNGLVPRDHWLEDWEKLAITDFAKKYPLEGYRRLAFMMLDADVVAVSPSSVYRVLKAAGLLQSLWPKSTRKGTGFVQPLQAHEHWHIDFSYVNIGGTFYYLCSILDGASRFIVHWEIREAMKEADAELVLQRAREKHPQARPRIISDNGPQFVAKEFKEFIRLWQTSHVFTSPHYPQSNGKLERWHRTLKEQAIRPKTPLSLEQARAVGAEFVEHYNTMRLHSAIGYVTPQAKLEGRAEQIWKDRDAKLEAARERRREKRATQKKLAVTGDPACN
jgi:putative transposase